MKTLTLILSETVGGQTFHAQLLIPFKYVTTSHLDQAIEDLHRKLNDCLQMHNQTSPVGANNTTTPKP